MELIETWIVLHHAAHTHSVQPSAAGATASPTISRTGHLESDIIHRVQAPSTNAAGLSDSTFVDLLPRLVTMTLTTTPAGLQLTLDHQPHATPLTFRSVEGLERAVGAPQPQILTGLSFEFSGRRHGGAPEQTILTPTEEMTFSARYAEAGVANLPPSTTSGSRMFSSTWMGNFSPQSQTHPSPRRCRPRGRTPRARTWCAPGHAMGWETGLADPSVL